MKYDIEVLGEVLRPAHAAGVKRAEAFRVAGSGRSVEYSDSGLEFCRGPVRSAPCDDEGQPTRRKVFIDAGVPTGYPHFLETSHRMGVDPVGNGFRGSSE